MTIKVIVLTDEEYNKIKGTVKTIDEKTYESFQDYNLSEEYSDVQNVIQDQFEDGEFSEKDVEYLSTQITSVIETLHKRWSYSDYVELIGDILHEVLEKNK